MQLSIPAWSDLGCGMKGKHQVDKRNKNQGSTLHRKAFYVDE
jgi:hypothetical protein